MEGKTMQKTYLAKREERGTRWNQAWYVVDASGQPLGRLAAKIARVLQGKHKPVYTPHVDVGDYVVVVNFEHVMYTGNKRQQKIYRYYTGYPSGLRENTLEDVLAKHPTQPLFDAVRRMMPKTKMGRKMFAKLKVYVGSDHPHEAQNPQLLEL